MKKLGLIALLLLTGCSSTMERTYVCSTSYGYTTAYFDKDGTVALGMNGDLMLFDYEKDSKNLYAISGSDGKRVGYIYADDKGLMVHGLVKPTDKEVIPCTVE